MSAAERSRLLPVVHHGEKAPDLRVQLRCFISRDDERKVSDMVPASVEHEGNGQASGVSVPDLLADHPRHPILGCRGGAP
ncbi:hypothetical protein [Streptomyces formicae]|uniref:Uncharacterized protein n=1 Tax=Streptomyces formicae TaxID=1616117 RepID=A0A291QL23_9ACTN|nr:hypothetical protein [Streptomyces formicae]ATL32272.1 hypothetical protein KY5_7254 [Streptomyces formicae]